MERGVTLPQSLLKHHTQLSQERICPSCILKIRASNDRAAKEKEGKIHLQGTWAELLLLFTGDSSH